MKPVQKPYQPIEHYAPWFDGISFDPEAFAISYQKKKFSHEQIWEVHWTIDKLGGIIIIPSSSLSNPVINEGMRWRQQLTQELVNIRHPAQWKEWKRLWPQRIDEKTSPMSTNDRAVFLMYLGLNKESFQELKAPLSYKELSTLVQEIQPSFWSPRTSQESQGIKALSIGPSTPTQAFLAEDRWAAGLVQEETGKPNNKHINPTEIYSLFQQDVEQMTLTGIKLPLGAIQSPGDLQQFRKEVQQFSQALGVRTKMGPEALGIGHRIFWDFTPSDRPNAQAHTQRVASEIYEIQSTWSSLSHEWFHALTRSMNDTHDLGSLPWGYSSEYYSLNAADRYTMRAFWHLRDGIQQSIPSKKSWPIIMNQAQYRAQQFLTQQWQYNPFEGDGAPNLSSEKQAVQLSLSQFSSYDAAVVATHVYWLQHPKKSPGMSTWVARRQLMDRMLVQSGWGSTPGTNVKPGYFSEPEEWLAASFQADMRAFGNLTDTDTSLMNTPLDQEAQDYSIYWDQFFTRIQPWWTKDRQA